MKRSTLLAGALLVIAGWGAWSLLGRTADGPAPAGDRPAARRGKDALDPAKVPVVVSDLALPGSGEVFVRERNLFEFAQAPEELARLEAERRAQAEAARLAAEKAAEAARIAREQQAALDAKRLQDAAAAAALRATQPVVPPPPVPPSFAYQYVGTIGPVGDPFAVLSAADKTYRYVRAGEIIDRQFKLEYIGEFRLDLSYTDEKFQNQFTQVQRLADTTARR